ncbi:unnamed protein product [Parnassius apollo]|uniref:(apollo) hypothetical protein n=1 Tax=Parnassius apollo TaxID=110799 RepID=A0A8S3WVD3_PARAO|nr:unnamed protein product [Parnassius apollo]
MMEHMDQIRITDLLEVNLRALKTQLEVRKQDACKRQWRIISRNHVDNDDRTSCYSVERQENIYDEQIAAPSNNEMFATESQSVSYKPNFEHLINRSISHIIEESWSTSVTEIPEFDYALNVVRL